MNWYQAVRWAHTVKNPLVCTDGELIGATEDELCRGTNVSTWDESSWLRAEEYSDGEEPDDVLQECFDIPVFSARLRKALEAAGIGGIQYLAIQVFDARRRPVEGFAVANLLNVRDVLDLKRSEYEVFGPDRPDRMGRIRDLRRPVLRLDAVEGLDIMRPREFPYVMLVSTKFHNVFADGGFFGLDFRKVGLCAAEAQRSRR